ncbi:MAG: hypothetical protein KJ646_00450 [Nanoarchaeota archaeon]|nr:hypothetical protein [Nanoarchaeota archaeon]MBU4116732.1 hypothetical protein [Nanoarchaeota archaeon]
MENNVKTKIIYFSLGVTITAASLFGINYLTKPDYVYSLKKDVSGVHNFINNISFGGGSGHITFNELLNNDFNGIPSIADTLQESNLTGDTPLSSLEIILIK